MNLSLIFLDRRKMDKGHFTQRDLDIAAELGALTKTIMNMDDKITLLMNDNIREHTAIWAKVDKHADKLDDHSGFLKKIAGVGVVLQLIWGAILAWFHK